MIIYLIRNKINNKVYIGQTSRLANRRWYEHQFALKLNKHTNELLQRSVNKYGIDNFEYIVIDNAKDKSDLSTKEKFWIQYYNSTDRSSGYNLTFGGEKYVTTEEVRHKLSKANIGKKLSEEHKRKISLALKGRIMSEVHRKKLSESGKRKVFTEQHKANMRNKTVSKETRKKISDAVKTQPRDSRGKLTKRESSV